MRRATTRYLVVDAGYCIEGRRPRTIWTTSKSLACLRVRGSQYRLSKANVSVAKALP